MRTRRGTALVELLLVIWAAGVILTMTALLMHGLMHAQARSRSLADIERNSLRLAGSFRNDVHRATAAKTMDDGLADNVALTLTLDQNQSIEYRRDETTVQRVVLEGANVVSREQFIFAPGIQLAIRKQGDRLFELSIDSQRGELPMGDGTSQPSLYAVPVNMHVEAGLNREGVVAAALTTHRGTP